MKFFKHFTDAHIGKSLRALERAQGMAGVGRYWTLVEICAAKLEKHIDEEFTEDHCKFEFDKGYLRDTLSTHQFRTLEMFMRCVGDVGLMSFICHDDVYTISMPKLLESMDRDTVRARQRRGSAAPKKKIKIENKNIHAACAFDFDRAYQKYPKKIKGGGAEQRFKDQIKTQSDYDDLMVAIDHYIEFLALPENSWRSPKQSFATFLGTKSNPFWRDYVSRDCLKTKNVQSVMNGISDLLP